MNRIALGTAEFGLDYGLVNKRSTFPLIEIKKILTLAWKNGIRILDTAQEYGIAESKLGDILQNDNIPFKTITKVGSGNILNIEASIVDSIQKLRINKLYGVLLHAFQSYLEHPSSFDKLNILKENNVIEKIGFSVYFPKEVEHLLDKNVQFDLIQLPYNVFDQRFEYLFEELNSRNVEIHARSIFLQGLFFIPSNQIPVNLSKSETNIARLQELAIIHNIPVSAICLNFVLQNNLISNAILGVNSMDELEKNLNSNIYTDKFSNIEEEVRGLNMTDESIILPFNWVQ